ncbi:MAG: dephospho-CoA kinase [bacterium]
MGTPVADPFDAVISLTRAAPVLPSGVGVLAVDGRSGAGKSELATAVAAHLDATVVRLDHLYPGWDGLEAGVDRLVEWILRPLRAGDPVRWRRYDWLRERFGRWRDLQPTPLVIVEGVGAGARRCAPFLSALVWVEAPRDVRRRRALERDGDTYAPHWNRWAAQEDHYIALDQPAARADLIITS